METIEIRLFGPMLVRRADGSVVQQAEWRTSKTMDLLRLLALNAGQAVTISSLLDKLWPEVEAERGRASLRTAASQLRKILRTDNLERRPGSMILHRAWVDTHAYSALMVDADRARRAGEHAETVLLVRQAESLYVDDIEVHDTAGDWLEAVHREWRERRLELLLDAADAAAAVRWARDSLDFASQAFRIDPHSEHAGRAMMRALAGLGEMEKALSVYDRLRHDLAEHFGVDPSPQTRALHLQLLTGTVQKSHAVGVIGHADAVDSLVAALSRVRRSAEGCGLVWLCGEAGSGRESVVEAASRQLGLSMRNMNREPVWMPRQPLDSSRVFSGPVADVVVMPSTEHLPSHALSVLVTLVRRQQVTLVVPLVQPVASAPGILGSEAGIAIEAVEVPALSDDDLASLARAVLQGEPAEDLVLRLRNLSSGLAGVASSLLRNWLEEGRIVWTADGLDLRVADDEQGSPPAGVLRRSLPLLRAEELDVLCMVAVADVQISRRDVNALMTAWYPGWNRDTTEVLGRLVERDLLRLTPEGFRLQQRASRRELLDWLRPWVRQKLHRLVAETLVLDPASRVQHWMAAGRYQLACDAGAGSLAQACMADDRPAALALLEVLRTLPPKMQPLSVNQPLGMYLDNVQRELQRTAPGGPSPEPVDTESHDRGTGQVTERQSRV